MSRLTGYRPTSLSLEQAFQLLGKGPSREKLGWVADRLRESEVEVDYGDPLVELALATRLLLLLLPDLVLIGYQASEELRAAMEQMAAMN